jgi:hypothetical protein
MFHESVFMGLYSMLYICDPCYSLERVLRGHGCTFVVFGVVYTTIYIPVGACP